MSFEDTILLRIRRQFDKDEAVAELLDRIKKLSFEVGELKSEIAELEYRLEKHAVEKEFNRDIKGEDAYVRKLKHHYRRLKKDRDQERRDKLKWRDRYLLLYANTQGTVPVK